MSTSTSQRERGVVIVGSLPAETNCITINPNKDGAILILPVNNWTVQGWPVPVAFMYGSDACSKWAPYCNSNSATSVNYKRKAHYYYTTLIIVGT